MSSNIEIKKKCKWCGQIFIAHKTTTNYCSHRCNNAAYKERIRQERIASYQKEFSMNAEEPSVEDKEFYTPPEAAKLLGISRASIYRYMADNVIKAVQFKGKTLVRRKDIELLFENAAEYKTAMYQGRSDNLSSFRNFKEATNYKGSKYGNLTVNDYAQAAKINDQTILALQNQKKIAMAKLKTLSPGSPEYQKVLDEINGYTQAILDAAKSTAEFKKAAVEIRFKPFDDAIDSLDELIDDCDTLKGMLDSDTFFSDAGDLTAQGAANIALIYKGLNAEQQKIADYKAQWEMHSKNTMQEI